jgi:hypothetical protein
LISLGLQVTLMDAVTRTAFSSTANFEVRSSKLLNVRSDHGLSCTAASERFIVTLLLMTVTLHSAR